MKHIILALVAAFSASTAFAGDTGAYIAASVGTAEQKLTVEDFSMSKDDTGTSIAIGYRVTPAFGLEAGYAAFGTLKLSAEGAELSSKPSAFYAAATGTYQVNPAFAFTGKLGVARDSTKLTARFGSEFESITEKETSLVVGMGVSYAFSPNVALIAEYHNFGKIAKDDEGTSLKASMMSIGVRYSF